MLVVCVQRGHGESLSFAEAFYPPPPPSPHPPRRPAAFFWGEAGRGKVDPTAGASLSTSSSIRSAMSRAVRPLGYTGSWLGLLALASFGPASAAGSRGVAPVASSSKSMMVAVGVGVRVVGFDPAAIELDLIGGGKVAGRRAAKGLAVPREGPPSPSIVGALPLLRGRPDLAKNYDKDIPRYRLGCGADQRPLPPTPTPQPVHPGTCTDVPKTGLGWAGPTCPLLELEVVERVDMAVSTLVYREGLDATDAPICPPGAASEAAFTTYCATVLELRTATPRKTGAEPCACGQGFFKKRLRDRFVRATSQHLCNRNRHLFATVVSMSAPSPRTHERKVRFQGSAVAIRDATYSYFDNAPELRQ